MMTNSWLQAQSLCHSHCHQCICLLWMMIMMMMLAWMVSAGQPPQDGHAVSHSPADNILEVGSCNILKWLAHVSMFFDATCFGCLNRSTMHT